MVQADGQRVHGDKIVIAAGSEPVVPPVPGRELAITSDDVLFLPRFPESLVLVGGGVIGLEMAGAFSDLGSRVTVIVRETEILPALDGDVSAYIRKILEGRGVSFHLGATLERLSGERGAVTAHVRKDGAPLTVTAQQVCLAVGRRYNPPRGDRRDRARDRSVGLTGRCAPPDVAAPRLRSRRCGGQPAAHAHGGLRGEACGAQRAPRRRPDRGLRSRPPDDLYDAGGRARRTHACRGAAPRRQVPRRQSRPGGRVERKGDGRGRRLPEARLRRGDRESPGRPDGLLGGGGADPARR